MWAFLTYTKPAVGPSAALLAVRPREHIWKLIIVCLQGMCRAMAAIHDATHTALQLHRIVLCAQMVLTARSQSQLAIRAPLVRIISQPVGIQRRKMKKATAMKGDLLVRRQEYRRVFRLSLFLRHRSHQFSRPPARHRCPARCPQQRNRACSPHCSLP